LLGRRQGRGGRSGLSRSSMDVCVCFCIRGSWAWALVIENSSAGAGAGFKLAWSSGESSRVLSFALAYARPGADTHVAAAGGLDPPTATGWLPVRGCSREPRCPAPSPRRQARRIRRPGDLAVPGLPTGPRSHAPPPRIPLSGAPRGHAPSRKWPPVAGRWARRHGPWPHLHGRPATSLSLCQSVQRLPQGPRQATAPIGSRCHMVSSGQRQHGGPHGPRGYYYLVFWPATWFHRASGSMKV
jgi:hypothetical protein